MIPIMKATATTGRRIYKSKGRQKKKTKKRQLSLSCYKSIIFLSSFMIVRGSFVGIFFFLVRRNLLYSFSLVSITQTDNNMEGKTLHDHPITQQYRPSNNMNTRSEKKENKVVHQGHDSISQSPSSSSTKGGRDYFPVDNNNNDNNNAQLFDCSINW